MKSIDQNRKLRDRLFPLIQNWHPNQKLAGKITEMLLKIDKSELVHIFDDEELLKDRAAATAVTLKKGW